MSFQMMLNVFADDAAILKAQGVAEAEIDTTRSDQTSQRQAMCLKRWRQVWEMCMSAVRAIEEVCPGSFLTEEPGRTKEDLNATVDDVIG